MAKQKGITVQSKEDSKKLADLLNDGYYIIDGWKVYPNTKDEGLNIILEKGN